MAINPLISTVGWLLPSIILGETITSQVLALPTTGPLVRCSDESGYVPSSFCHGPQCLQLLNPHIDIALGFVIREFGMNKG